MNHQSWTWWNWWKSHGTLFIVIQQVHSGYHPVDRLQLWSIRMKLNLPIRPSLRGFGSKFGESSINDDVNALVGQNGSSASVLQREIHFGQIINVRRLDSTMWSPHRSAKKFTIQGLFSTSTESTDPLGSQPDTRPYLSSTDYSIRKMCILWGDLLPGIRLLRCIERHSRFKTLEQAIIPENQIIIKL